MKISAKADYAVRALCELAARHGDGPVKGEVIAVAQRIPQKFLENILSELKRLDFVRTQRGAEGGYRLARDPSAVSLAQVIRAVDGPLADVRGERPEQLELHGGAVALQEVWLALRVSVRRVLEGVTLADVARCDLPPLVADLLADPNALRSY
jgi:Rrf2 family protein